MSQIINDLSEEELNNALNEISEKRKEEIKHISKKYDSEYNMLMTILHEKYGPKYEEYVGRYFLKIDGNRIIFYSITKFEDMKLYYKSFSFFIRYIPENEDLPRQDVIRTYEGYINSFDFDFNIKCKIFIEVSKENYNRMIASYDCLLDIVENIATISTNLAAI